MKRVMLMTALLFLGCAHADERGAVIVAEVRSGKVAYGIDGRQQDLDNTIAALRERARKTGISPDKDVAIVLVSKDLTLNQMQNLHSALAAYGFLDIRLLAFASDQARLQQITLGTKPIRFSKDRAELMQSIGIEK